jgi:ComF family protein
MAATYEGTVKQLIRAYKFERVRAAYAPLACAVADQLPYLPVDTVVVHIPTASVRVRQRGYDQSKLLAQEVARLRGLDHQPLLRRRHGDRQVGSSRSERMKQAERAFELKPGIELHGKQILLIDDVTTSGATLMAAAKLLKAAGAERVDAAVVAKHTLE